MPDVLSNDDVLSFDPRSPFLTAPDAGGPPPVAASRAAADLQPRIDEAGRRSQAAIDAAERSMDQEDRNAATRERELAPLRERQMEMARQSIPQPPKTKESPPAPQRQNQHDDETWLFAAGLLGALAGAATRNHATNALAAFSGAISGYQEGSKQKFDEQMQIWNAENKRAQEASQNALAEYRGILENRKLTMEQMSVELQLASAKHDDKAMATAAKTKNWMTIAGLYDKHEQALVQSQTSADRLTFQYEQMKNKEQTQLAVAQMRALGVVPGQENALIDQIGQYKIAPIGGARGAAIMNLVAQKFPDYDATKWFEKGAGARVSGATSARVDQRTEISFAVGPEARNVRSLNVAIAHLDTLDELAKALGNSDFKRVNQLSNRVETELGYSMPTSFDAAKQIVSAEIIKAIVANGGGVNERKEAAENLATAGSYQQLNGVIKTYKSLLGGQMKGLQKQYESGTGKKDFLEKLEPETIKALNEAGVAPHPQSTPPGYRKTVPKPEAPPSSPADMPMMLPEGWKLEQVQ
jgi:hypothetical protein